ncbi:MAG: TetR/AcrR family transcriptional regulator, cholesterol catabolism regulator [Gammaproteobacteria bacterium]|jgi:AcrR family transcriptional regulator|nr:TetR/AcrR family transcriptional regulator, cholesterol catabolism regulator [Gammaproteobacteria bacterium]
MSLRKRAQRMSPNQRREQIMDSAVALIVSRGLSSCTLELVAVEARISKPLIYRYFPKLANLFKALVEREYRFLRGRGLDVLPKNAAYEEVIHRSNLRTMEYLYERGPIMRLLASDRSIAGLAKRQDRDERRVIMDYFAKRCVEEYGVPQEVARVCSIMTVNAPILSVRALRSSGIAAHRAAEIWSDFVIGGNYALRLKYGKPKQVKPRKRRKPLS